MSIDRPLRILLVCPMFPPQRGIGPLRTYSFARTWSQLGHDVTVLSTQKRNDQVGLNLPFDGFRVAEVDFRAPWMVEKLRQSTRAPEPTSPTAGTASSGPAKRAMKWLKSRTGIFSAVRQPDTADWWIPPAFDWARHHGPWDVVVSSGGPPAAHLVAEKVRRANIALAWMADFRDLWTNNHIYSGLFPFTLMEHLREKRMLDVADRVVTVSNGLADVLRRKTVHPVDVIYNGYDAYDFARIDPTPAFPKDDRVRLVYTGTVYSVGQDVDPVCAAIAREPRATLVVAGENASAWIEGARKHGIGDRLDWRHHVPRQESLRLQRDASALVLLDWRHRRHGVLTGKLFEYLVSPAPIWVIGGEPGSEAGDLVTRTGRGVHLLKEENVRLALRRLIQGDQPSPRSDQEQIRQLGRHQQAARMLGLIHEMVETFGNPK